MNKLELQKVANEVRKGIITSVHAAKAGHPGGSLSAADIFTYLYFEEMNVDPKDPKKADRDRFVLSKGHTAPGLYSALAQKGYFPVEDLETLRHLGSYLQGHPDMKHIPGVDMSSGSLGQGISAAVGMAIAGKMDNADYFFFHYNILLTDICYCSVPFIGIQCIFMHLIVYLIGTKSNSDEFYKA